MYFNSGDNSIASDVRWWCRLASDDTTLYPLADIARNANMALEKTTALIMRSDNSWEWDDANNTTQPVADADLEGGQEDYAIPVTHLKILRVRVKDQSGNYVTLTPRSRRLLSDSELASTGTPETYDVLGNSIYLNPKPPYDYTAGLEVQFQRGPSYFTAASVAVEPGFAAQFHRLISLYTALDYCDIHLPDQAKVIRDRIGTPPDPGHNIVGSGLEGELVEFYSSRDYDRPQSLSVRKEDHGAGALGDGYSPNPRGIS